MPRPRPLTPAQAKRTLAHRFTRLADRLRQLPTKFGIRPQRVFLVWTIWSGDEAGEGRETVLAEFEILPTPKVLDSASAILRDPRSAGYLPTGSIVVSNVSNTLTRDMLKGHQIPRGRRVDLQREAVSFFYELREDGRGDNPPERDRYILAAEPSREAGFVQWNLFLSRSSEDRSRQGYSQVGVDR